MMTRLSQDRGKCNITKQCVDNKLGLIISRLAQLLCMVFGFAAFVNHFVDHFPIRTFGVTNVTVHLGDGWQAG